MNNLGVVFSDIGYVYLTRNQTQDAVDAWWKGIEIYHKAIALDSNKLCYWSNLGDAYSELGLGLSRQGNIQDSEVAYFEAIKIYIKFLTFEPQNSVF